MLGHKEADRQGEDNIVMLTFAAVVDFIGGLANLHPEILELLLERARVRQGGANTQPPGLQEPLHRADQLNLADVPLAASFAMPGGSPGNGDANDRLDLRFDKHIEHRSTHAGMIDHERALAPQWHTSEGCTDGLHNRWVAGA
jgi:hypothetical protein